MEILKRIKRIYKTLLLRILLADYSFFQRIFWEIQAKDIYDTWGSLTTGSYEVVSMIIDKYKPASILDAGCGAGRFFPIYKEKGIDDITGFDISRKALKLASKAFPDVKLMRIRFEDMEFGPKRFDLTISNRSLELVPKSISDMVIKKICFSTRLVYVSELTESEGIPEAKYMFIHNYEELFIKNGFLLKEKGYCDPAKKQTWFLFSDKEGVD